MSGVGTYSIGVLVNVTNDPVTGAASRGSQTKRIDPIALTLSHGDLANPDARLMVHTTALPVTMDSFARTGDGLVHWTVNSAVDVGQLN
ncbi:MAG: hypothetical protein QOI76_916 [Frankiales bacterium]|nr:hypothetical protein [Frankiales bacterium]